MNKRDDNIRIILINIFLIFGSLQAQIYEMDNINASTVTTCSGTFYDSRVGTSDYFNNENYTATFCSGTSEFLRFIFNPNENASGYAIAAGDTLRVYDGAGINGTLIALLTSTQDPGSNALVITSLSNCITFHWTSDAAFDSDGWEAAIECVPQGCGTNPIAADNFANAPFVCNFDGFCGTTSGYTEDEPFNFVGGGNCPTIFGGTIENNSWVYFIASGPNITFQIDVLGCYGAFGYNPNPSAINFGVQAAILNFNTTTDLFTRVSDCALSDGQQLNMALTNTSPLIPGDAYYLVIDGSSGSICDYTISVTGDAETFEASGDTVLCLGDTAPLSANGPIGAIYTWQSIGGGFGPVEGSNINVSPTDSTWYYVQITGGNLCVNQTDTVFVGVQTCPIDTTICSTVAFNNITNLCTLDPSQAFVLLDTVFSVLGCDSIYNSTITSFIDTAFNVSNLCTIDPNQAGTILDTIPSNLGCDSIYNVTITTFVDTTFNSTNLCTLDPSQALVVLDTVFSVLGCDSIYNSTITSFIDTTFNVSNLCTLDPNQAGSVLDTVLSSLGCDSIYNRITTHLSYLTNIIDTICADQTYKLPGDSMVDGPGIYQVVLTSISGCDSTFLVELTEVQPSSIVNPIADTIVCEQDDEFIIDVSSYNALSVEWEDGSLSPLYIAQNTGDYSVQLTQQNGCVVSDTIRIQFIDCINDCEVILPNGFSPNGDNVNDKFSPIRICEYDLSQFTFGIYNRWGELLFETEDPLAYWDGTFLGKAQPLDVYLFYVHFTFDGQASSQTITGNVTLIR